MLASAWQESQNKGLAASSQWGRSPCLRTTGGDDRAYFKITCGADGIMMHRLQMPKSVRSVRRSCRLQMPTMVILLANSSRLVSGLTSHPISCQCNLILVDARMAREEHEARVVGSGNSDDICSYSFQHEGRGQLSNELAL